MGGSLELGVQGKGGRQGRACYHTKYVLEYCKAYTQCVSEGKGTLTVVAEAVWVGFGA